MAWLEKRGETFHINFFHCGKHYSRSLRTNVERKAHGAKARLEENLIDVERGRLDVPPGAELTTLLLSDGKVERKVVVRKEVTLGELLTRYKQEIPAGVKDIFSRYPRANAFTAATSTSTSLDPYRPALLLRFGLMRYGTVSTSCGVDA
jgi:hypothetical protein